MEARIKNMQAILNDAWGPMVALGKCLATSPVPEKTRELVHMRTAQINGPCNRSVLRIDRRRVRRAVAEHPHARVERIEHDAVRAALHVDRLDHRQRFGIPHHHRFAAPKPVMGLGIHSHAPRVGLRDLAHRRQRIQIEHRNPGHVGRSRPRDIQPPPIHVGVDVVETSSAADLDRLHHLVSTGAKRHCGDSHDNRQAQSLHVEALQPSRTLTQSRSVWPSPRGA